MVDLDIRKDGYISGAQLEVILDAMVSELGKAFDAAAVKLDENKSAIKRLQSELDTERRLRLGMKQR